MSFLSRLDRHARLVERMADTLGIDLAEKMMMGQLPPEQYRAAAIRCTGCTETDACASWVDAHPEGAALAPDYCRNKAQFERTAAR